MAPYDAARNTPNTMILTLSLCALISAFLLSVIILWQRHRDGAAIYDTSTALAEEITQYQSLMEEIDARVNLGETDSSQAAQEKAVAARRLIKAKQSMDLIARAPAIAPVAVFCGIFVASLGAVFIYFNNGRHDYRDYPYKRQLKAWTEIAGSDPDSLPPIALAAVLRQGQVEKANDSQYWLFVGRIEMMAENYYAGTKAFQRAQTLEGAKFRAWSELGEALTFVADGFEGAEAVKAFHTALSFDPLDARAHYYLGKFSLTEGRYDEAREHFKIAQSRLAPDDSRNQVIDAQLKATDVAQKGQNQMKERIGTMVAGLEEKLRANPNDPEGWARLIRSYGVLGQSDKQSAAIVAMKTHYAGSPRTVTDILSRSEAAVGAENTSGGL